ncbi:hypothetical protein Dsin_033160 [Dipteronia sinensis]|uniref:Protein FAR1-RELATED SEQUENCE n=1 Tax=Dipteronia sinensis TaxID=43782 RepID=A0AAE0DJM3_9ROSI|nr:hypothetical protein Dsin_033160 [Dipteronia sinensis]
MSSLAPTAIITDQDKAMQKAIEVVFPTARHRWCLWHIMKKLPEKLKSYKHYEDIKSVLQNIVYDSLTCGDFEDRWNEFINLYDLHTNEWLLGLYDERRRWVPAFVKDTFWVGIMRMRCEIRKEKECHADFISFNSCIPCVTHYPLEKQFQEAYTTEKFKDFQQELSANLYCEVSLDKENFPCSEFTVGENVMVGNTITTIPFTVLLKEADFEINCNCRLFEFKGILCRHVIAVLIHKKICFAPDEYILMQWRKDVIRCYTKVKIGYDNWSIKPEGHRFDKMCNSFYEVAHLATSNDDKCNIVLEMINDLKMKLISYEGDDGSIQRIINLSDDTEDKNFHSAPKENRNILTPMAVRSKGRPPFKRKQSKVDQIVQKRKQNKSRAKSNPQKTMKNLERFQSEELVTVTVDNPHIFNNIEDNFATQERIVNKVLML